MDHGREKRIGRQSAQYVRLSPCPVTVANEGLGWDSLLKMVHNPGGNWHPGRGDNPSNTFFLVPRADG